MKYQPIKKISEYKLQKYPSPFIPSSPPPPPLPPPSPPYNLRKRKTTTTNKVPNKTTKKILWKTSTSDKKQIIKYLIKTLFGKGTKKKQFF